MHKSSCHQRQQAPGAVRSGSRVGLSPALRRGPSDGLATGGSPRPTSTRRLTRLEPGLTRCNRVATSRGDRCMREGTGRQGRQPNTSYRSAASGKACQENELSSACSTEGRPRIRLSSSVVRGEFSEEMATLSGQQFHACYQCGNCSSGCPLAEEMDILPSQVMRLVQLGQRGQLMASRTIWICASCLQCTVRCPRGIDIEAVMDALKQVALDAGVDHFGPGQISPELAAEVPQPGLVSAYRKLST